MDRTIASDAIRHSMSRFTSWDSIENKGMAKVDSHINLMTVIRIEGHTSKVKTSQRPIWIVVIDIARCK